MKERKPCQFQHRNTGRVSSSFCHWNFILFCLIAMTSGLVMIFLLFVSTTMVLRNMVNEMHEICQQAFCVFCEKQKGICPSTYLSKYPLDYFLWNQGNPIWKMEQCTQGNTHETHSSVSNCWQQLCYRFQWQSCWTTLYKIKSYEQLLMQCKQMKNIYFTEYEQTAADSLQVWSF